MFEILLENLSVPQLESICRDIRGRLDGMLTVPDNARTDEFEKAGRKLANMLGSVEDLLSLRLQAIEHDLNAHEIVRDQNAHEIDVRLSSVLLEIEPDRNTHEITKPE